MKWQENVKYTPQIIVWKITKVKNVNALWHSRFFVLIFEEHNLLRTLSRLHLGNEVK